jgi:hypothetical protein
MGRKGVYDEIIVYGMNAEPRVVHREDLHHHVNINIIGGSGIHLNHDCVYFGIQAKHSTESCLAGSARPSTLARFAY